MRNQTKTHYELIRFALVGLLSTVLYFTVFAILMKTEIKAAIAGFVAYVSIMGFTYLLQRNWTFRSQAAHRSALFRYAMTHLVGISLNSGILGICVDWLGLPTLYSQIFALALIFSWSYIAQKYMVFGRASRQKSES